jgi:hypothetical protein
MRRAGRIGVHVNYAGVGVGGTHGERQQGQAYEQGRDQNGEDGQGNKALEAIGIRHWITLQDFNEQEPRFAPPQGVLRH